MVHSGSGRGALQPAALLVQKLLVLASRAFVICLAFLRLHMFRVAAAEAC